MQFPYSGNFFIDCLAWEDIYMKIQLPRKDTQMQFAKRSIAMTAAYGFLALVGIGVNSAGAAVSVYGSVTSSAFSGNIQKATTLTDAQNLASSTCATTPGASCAEFVSCSGGGYASIAWAMSPNRMAAACGFPTQAEANAAALTKCGSGCSQGDQLFDPAAVIASGCGSSGSPNSGCTASTVPTTTTPPASTTPNATDSANIPRVFNWAEATYPQYFAPSGQFCQDGYGYRFRYYSGSKSYLAAKDGRVYVLIPALSGTILNVGTLDDLLVMAKAAGF